MIKAGKQIAVCALLLIIFCLVCRFVFFRNFIAYVPLLPVEQDAARLDGVRLDIEAPEVLGAREPEIGDGFLRIPIEPGKPGETNLYIRIGNRENASMHVLRVGRFGTVYDRNNGNFTGDTAVLIAVALFWLLTCAIAVRSFIRAKGAAFYSYATIFFAGLSLFSLISGAVFVQITIAHIANPLHHTMMGAYSVINGIGRQVMMLTTPLILAFAIAMAISNLALLRHERPRPQNALGLLVSLLLIAGEAAGWYLFTRDFMGSSWEGKIIDILENTYATVFVYFECMLAGSVICGIRAAKHKPPLDRDFIIILGCWFRKDGTLPPLLKGRADAALAFWRKQKEETGKEAVFIPTGGQGRDETMPEAEAIRRYLLSREIPERLILPECRAMNTYQNMRFSGEIIQKTNPEGKAAFSTTNYHVFRSGVWASLAGLPAEGIGSRTKWWFWPNAFMRETAGLLANRWKQETLLMIALLVFFAAMSFAMGGY